ncbi:ABC transporter, ATP-binding protein [Marvinbryantia formatexigens DSM 14469]|uniref:ABC transporter, ATP-binding protein n=1 Tax=Marvinbryantia formatexigens DSM 14469 TaxID=478749 RepID=C6L9D3_9FIRM|nr:ATP-binding cassette domain-containing protein [Marvinbryantia formatexigens]EET62872.1 ABC transporter, ATP-binding protein [Marvinbryantia formatexigens DSM 14469]UWO23472.1 ATP-binding cassette domain-containing protein [Marvinbryantia formatexigens DSM 14469]SDG57326.1 ABC-2 type transport system ATP-binding protein [Marvinbryantia formatexigens]
MKIEIDNITKKIGSQTVLDCISLSMESPAIYGLKGRNGSGKTMLMRAICGLIRLSEGEIRINGEILRKDISFPRSVGILIESPGFISHYSAYENLEALISIKNIVSRERITETLEMVGLEPGDKKSFRKFSLGMKQKLGIAAAIIEEPELVILDEPTNALDEQSLERLKKILGHLKEKGALVIISCHDTEDLLALSDVIIEMQDGKVISEWKINR